MANDMTAPPGMSGPGDPQKYLESLSRDDLLRYALAALTAFEKVEAERDFFQYQADIANQEKQHLFQMAEITRKINIIDRHLIAETAVREIPAMLKAEFGALYLFHPERQELALDATNPPDTAKPEVVRMDTTEHFLAWFLSQEGDADLIPDLGSFCRGKGLTPPGVAAVLQGPVLCCPLRKARSIHSEDIQGVFLIGGKTSGFVTTDTELANTVCTSLSAALLMARLLAQLETYAFTDSLTRLKNRRSFQNTLLQQTTTSRRYGQTLALAYLDIDFFKRVNDTYGHSAGDDILRAAARRLQAAVRKDVDICARYGGEEFVVLFPHTTLAGAKAFAERIRHMFSDRAFDIDGRLIPITCSIGIAEYEACETPERFVERADAAMYRAKQSGRNRVEAAEANPPNAPDAE